MVTLLPLKMRASGSQHCGGSQQCVAVAVLGLQRSRACMAVLTVARASYSVLSEDECGSELSFAPAAVTSMLQAASCPSPRNSRPIRSAALITGIAGGVGPRELYPVVPDSPRMARA